MKQEQIKLKFNITSYNFTENDIDTPTEMNLIITKEVNVNKNFLKIVDAVARKYKLHNAPTKYCLDDIYRILWSEHFSGSFLDELLKNIDKDDYSKLDVSVKELDNQFNIKDKTINLTILCEEYNKDMKFFFRIDKSKRNAIPHVHCRCCGKERIIDLKRLEFIENPFESRILTLQALNIVNKYQRELIKYWEKIIKSEEEILEFDLVI